MDVRFCECRRSWGVYEPDGLQAAVSEGAIPVGFSNGSFAEALLNQPEAGLGHRFEAFVIPSSCPTVTYYHTLEEWSEKHG